jgi:hypothetical protein
MQEIDRRQLGKGVAYAATALLGPETPEQPTKEKRSPFVVANDRVKLFVQDWGHGRPIVFVSAWTFHCARSEDHPLA